MNHRRQFRALQAELAEGLEKQATLQAMFSGVGDDFWFWALTEGRETEPLLRQILPDMPPPQIQANFTGRSGRPALREAYEIYRLFKRLAKRHGKALDQCERILDFGCGWGRILRFFLKDVDEANAHGADCYGEMIDLCRSQRLRGRFEVTPILPPSRLPDGQFDVIYLYSVFSHLSEAAHLAWLREFHRILKPGGLVIATTRPRNFIEICGALNRKRNVNDWQRGAAQSFSDPAQALADYDAGRFVHSPTGGGGCLDQNFYGESCISEKYARREWTQIFPEVEYLPVWRHFAFDQNVIVAIKGLAGGRPGAKQGNGAQGLQFAADLVRAAGKVAARAFGKFASLFSAAANG